MTITMKHIVLIIINVALILVFGAFYILRANYEFIIFLGVIILVGVLIARTLNKVNYTFGTLVGLTGWSVLHLAGGAVPVGDGRLYDTILIPLSETYPIFRYDQLVHMWGFGVATLLTYCLLSKSVDMPFKHPISMAIVIIMGGLGFGAFNEVVEFFISLTVSEAQIGGYMNTSLDLCANLIGAILAYIYIRLRYLPKTT